MGKPWGSIAHRVWIGDRVVETYAIQRRPRDERWSLKELMKVDATPWQWEPFGERGHVEPEVVGRGGAALGQEEEEGDVAQPHPMHITRSDLEKWGYSLGCRRCSRVHNGKSGHGVRHAPECRRRIEERAREEGDPRVTRAIARKRKLRYGPDATWRGDCGKGGADAWA